MHQNIILSIVCIVNRYLIYSILKLLSELKHIFSIYTEDVLYDNN